MKRLYNALAESSACGVGLVANLRGRSSNKLIQECRMALTRIKHRGAGDKYNHDGCGLMTALPHAFLERQFERDLPGVAYPGPGRVGVGMVFHWRDTAAYREQVKKAAGTQGLRVIGWRQLDVSRDPGFEISQFYVDRGNLSSADFRVKLYTVQRHVAKLEEGYLSSLSSDTVVYKGLVATEDLFSFYGTDLEDPAYESHVGLLHSRFSTNTRSSWNRAQPNRMVAHNGEINTLSGNMRWIETHHATMSEVPSGILPICNDLRTDSGNLDAAIGLLTHFGGRKLPDVLEQMMPHADVTTPATAPWDGPALLNFTDGRYAGAILDRNGLRACRYEITKDTLYLGSEMGMWPGGANETVSAGSLEPGTILYADTETGEICHRKSLAGRVATAQLDRKLLRRAPTQPQPDGKSKILRRTYGYGPEFFERLLPSMVSGVEALGSMGNDEVLPVFSTQPRLLYDFFRQRFAQVTNPPIDAYRERHVINMRAQIGTHDGLLRNENARLLDLKSPMLTPEEFGALFSTGGPHRWRTATVNAQWDSRSESLSDAVARLVSAAGEAAGAAGDAGHVVLRISDHVDDDMVRDGVYPIPALLATGAVDAALRKCKTRHSTSILVDTLEAREVHHIACLLGLGADLVVPTMAYTLVRAEGGTTEAYRDACMGGVRKIMSKMGISMVRNYQGGRHFETIGLDAKVTEAAFPGLQNTVTGVGWSELEASVRDRCQGTRRVEGQMHVVAAGGEAHTNTPESIVLLQRAVRSNSAEAFREYEASVDAYNRERTIRGAFDFKLASGDSKQAGKGFLPLEQVEDTKSICKRFFTGAMSIGSISAPAHETLAVAMNRLGAHSNTGEGGESPERLGTERRSKIKQIASGRFGVTLDYLADADEIQIKMAQGAKPGEGGELPGDKVVGEIARIRHTSPGVTLISPPPHHDIYSIEDLKQLIYDLKQVNPQARVTVKLVSQRGIGTIAVGVVKAGADGIVVSGHDGGTGAAVWTGIKHAGSPFEIGLAEVNQALVENGMRDCVTLQTDGQLKTARDVMVAAMLGADQFGFSTAPLVAMGCVMMRQCHNNTCPVGIATQDPELVKLFKGTPEQVERYFSHLAEGVRLHLARLGVSSLGEICGRTDLLATAAHAARLDLGEILAVPSNPDGNRFERPAAQPTADDRLIEAYGSRAPLDNDTSFEVKLLNTDLTFGTKLGSFFRSLNKDNDARLRVFATGYGGQSFGAWLPERMSLTLTGIANDYVGKGLSGGNIVVRSPAGSVGAVAGNALLYGATGGTAYFGGAVGNRFAIRNSGATSVIEGAGSLCCEYMTGGAVIILGEVGPGFATGMTGGACYLYEDGASEGPALSDTVVSTEPSQAEYDWLYEQLSEQWVRTGSDLAGQLVEQWSSRRPRFTKVAPPLAATAATKDKLPERDARRNFLDVPRSTQRTYEVKERISSPMEILIPDTDEKGAAKAQMQASRCMDCGVPFCQTSGCPIDNRIPEWNKLVTESDYRSALDRLHLTNNFPEFTGRVCPAPCESACVAGLVDDEQPVAIKRVENHIIDTAFSNGWIQPRIVGTADRRKESVAIVGSGPAGLAAADQLNQKGYFVTVLEREDRIGGLLMYGIPNMKLDKKVVDRRVDILRAEGVAFYTNCDVGGTSPGALSVEGLLSEYDACVIAVGAKAKRDLDVPNRNLHGIEHAEDYITDATRAFLDGDASTKASLGLDGQSVVVIGGGDTGTDALATSLRNDCKDLVNFEILEKPGLARDAPWPEMPRTFKVDYGHAESAAKFGRDPRSYAVAVQRFIPAEDDPTRVGGVETVQVRMMPGKGLDLQPQPGTEKIWRADKVLLALGYTGAEHGFLSQIDESQPGVFYAGDCRMGASLVVHAIREGREAAESVEQYLESHTLIEEQNRRAEITSKLKSNVNPSTKEREPVEMADEFESTVLN